VIEIDAIVADTEIMQGVALSGEVLLIGRATGIADQDTDARRWSTRGSLAASGDSSTSSPPAGRVDLG
jgi:hypothetical protein